MYVLTHNDRVMLGPIQWNSRMFMSDIEDELEIIVNILPSDVNNLPLDLGSGIMIRECVDDRPALNTKIQMYDGPFWTFTANLGTATYIVVDKPLSLVRSELKALIAEERYRREISGTTVVIQGQAVTVDTARGSRDVFVQQFLLLPEGNTSRWKFPEGWLLLTKADLGACVSAGVSHVQGQFGWEAVLGFQMDAVTTLAELDAIDISPNTRQPGPR